MKPRVATTKPALMMNAEAAAAAAIVKELMMQETILVLDISPVKRFGVLEATPKFVADEAGSVIRV